MYILNQNNNTELDFLLKIFPLISFVFGALVTLFITIFNTWYNDKVKRNKVKKYLVYTVESLIESSKIQSEYVSELIASLNKKPGQTPSLNVSSGFHTRNLDFLSKDELFIIFVLKKSGDKAKNAGILNNYFSAFEIVKYVRDSLQSDMERLKKLGYETSKRFNELFLSFKSEFNKRKFGNSLINRSKSNSVITDEIEIEKIVHMEIQEVYSAFSLNTNLEKTMFNFKDHLFMPSYSIAKKYNDIELQILIVEIMDLIDALSEARIAHISRFEHLNENIKITITNLTIIKEFLN